MSSFSQGAGRVVKHFVSSRRDKFRPPFGRDVVEIERQVVFAGSTNESHSGYLRDWTPSPRERGSTQASSLPRVAVWAFPA